jgi:DNA-binding beta-propeller fold protein YncE
LAVQIAVFAPLIRVLDGETDGVVATVQVGDHPYSIASDSAAGKIYVTRTYSNQLMVIDAATNHVSSIEAGMDRGMTTAHL